MKISPSESLTLQGDQVVSGPAGVTGYIARSPDGSLKVVVSGLAGTSDQCTPGCDRRGQQTLV